MKCYWVCLCWFLGYEKGFEKVCFYFCDVGNKKIKVIMLLFCLLSVR